MRKPTSTRRASSRKAGSSSSLPEYPELRMDRPRAKTFGPLNEAQAQFLNKIENNILTFAIGPAGTGKTMCAAIAAANAYKEGLVKKIIISRPAVTSGEEHGFLPGDMNEKFEPYIAPLLECLSKIMGQGQVEALVEHEKIVFLPLAYMRGHSWDGAFVIVDEAQNITKTQMKLALTRIGEGTKCIVDGDLQQRDIEAYGLDDAIQRLDGVKGVAVQKFTEDHIVRSGIVKDILKAYSNRNVDGETEGLRNYLGN